MTSFVCRPGLGPFNNVVPFKFSGTITAPPVKPPIVPTTGIGLYCIKAECTLLDKNSKTNGKFTGYDNTLEIIKKVENACEFKRSAVSGQRCDKAQVTFVDRSKHLPCQGEIFFEHNNLVRKVV